MRRLLFSILIFTAFTLSSCGQSAVSVVDRTAEYPAVVREISPRIEGGISMAIEAHYPRFVGEDLHDGLIKINEDSFNRAEEYADSAERRYAPDLDSFIGFGDYQFTVTAELTKGLDSDDSYVSVRYDYFEYAGGAHGMSYVGGVIYDSLTGETVSPAKAAGMTDAQLADAVKEKLLAAIKANPDEYYQDAAELLDTALNDAAYYLEGDSLVAVIQAYQIAPYTGGPQYVYISIDE